MGQSCGISVLGRTGGGPASRNQRHYSSSASSFGSSKFLGGELLDVHVLEGEHPHRLHEAVGTVDVPHPHVVHGQLEVEVVLGVLAHEFDLVGQVKPALGLHHVAKLRHDVAILAEQRQFHFSVVVFELVLVH